MGKIAFRPIFIFFCCITRLGWIFSCSTVIYLFSLFSLNWVNVKWISFLGLRTIYLQSHFDNVTCICVNGGCVSSALSSHKHVTNDDFAGGRRGHAMRTLASRCAGGGDGRPRWYPNTHWFIFKSNHFFPWLLYRDQCWLRHWCDWHDCLLNAFRRGRQRQIPDTR